MKKLTVCKSATLFFGLLAVSALTRLDSVIGYLRHGDMIGAALGLLSAIFGSQWVHYQQRQDEVSAKPAWPGWLRYLLFSSLLLLIPSAETQAQPTNYIVNTSNIIPVNGGQYNTIVGVDAGKVNTGYYNTFIGAIAGGKNSGGFYNVFLGTAAGANNTNGSSNSFMGYQAGLKNTIGANNTFLGYRTGYETTTSSNNTFLGFEAGANNNTGKNNTFVGSEAGVFNTTGFSNAFLSTAAGFSNTSGSYNSFAGTAAGYSNTSGTYNSFVGYQAGYFNSTGSSNAYLGYTAGFSNTNGTGNTFIGPIAGFNNTSGYSNTLLGVRAGYQNQSGSNNLALGDSAGYHNTASGNVMVGSRAGYFNQSGSRNTFLGQKADIRPGSPVLTNAAAIGSGALVATSNAIVLGDTILNTKVGIGITAPAFPLDVRGSINIRSGGLNFASRVRLQADPDEFLVLTAGAEGQSGLRFAHLTSKTSPANLTKQVLSVDDEGRVGLYAIGLPASQVRLQVNSAADWADFVFAPDYTLVPLNELVSYLGANHHLPGIPSTKEVQRDGIDIGTLNTVLLQKVEELTLYLIEQNKELTALKQQVLRLSNAH